jgi:hypothetical protein
MRGLRVTPAGLFHARPAGVSLRASACGSEPPAACGCGRQPAAASRLRPAGAGVSLRPAGASRLRPAACGRQPAACGLRASACGPAGLRACGLRVRASACGCGRQPAGLRPAGLRPAACGPAGLRPAGVSLRACGPAGLRPAGLRACGLRQRAACGCGWWCYLPTRKVKKVKRAGGVKNWHLMLANLCQGKNKKRAGPFLRGAVRGLRVVACGWWPAACGCAGIALLAACGCGRAGKMRRKRHHTPQGRYMAKLPSLYRGV